MGSGSCSLRCRRSSGSCARHGGSARWPRRAGWETFADGGAGYDLIHGFTASRAVLEGAAKPLMDTIERDGSIWISWPKKASKVKTDITEDVIRDVVLPIGLVDVKVAAVSEIWSGLKPVIRKELR